MLTTMGRTLMGLLSRPVMACGGSLIRSFTRLRPSQRRRQQQAANKGESESFAAFHGRLLFPLDGTRMGR
ncbi:hypothetical protein Q668_02740 [Alcanivorax sp. PN-3]|nr:hypothetical protein Q668_02740 [Alcanivorax sp. PN-3]